MNKWNIDKTHSEVGFKIKHLMVSTVRGKFNNFEGEIILPGDNMNKAVVSFTVYTSSIDTGNMERDGHLKSKDFFDSESFPTLTFVSTEIIAQDDSKYIVNGDLTMNGITKKITLDVTFNGIVTNMSGDKVMSFETLGSLSRKDFGLTWNAPIEQGGVVISDEIKLDINTEFTEEKK